MVLLLASLHSAGALVLNHHHHAPGRVVELGTRAGHAVMQHSKGWDDFGKPPFNFYKVSPTCVASLPWLAFRPLADTFAAAILGAILPCLGLELAWDSAWACTKSSACDSKPQPQPQPEPEPSTCCQGFDEFMAVFPDEDRDLYPEMFKLPAGCYEARSPCRENKAAQPRAGRLLRSLFRRSRTRLPRASANEPVGPHRGRPTTPRSCSPRRCRCPSRWASLSRRWSPERAWWSTTWWRARTRSSAGGYSRGTYSSP